MLSNLLIVGLKAFDFIAWELLGFTTIEVVEAMTDVIYLLEGIGL